MTPAELVELVTPHLPIGPYTVVAVANSLQVIIRDELVRRTLFIDDAARLLLVAIVEEATDMMFDELNGGIHTCYTACVGSHCESHEGHTDGTDIFAKLRAALAARSVAKEAVP